MRDKRCENRRKVRCRFGGRRLVLRENMCANPAGLLHGLAAFPTLLPTFHQAKNKSDGKEDSI